MLFLLLHHQGYDALQDTDNLKGDEQLEGLKIVNDHEFTVDLSQSDSAFATKLGYSGFYPLPESFYKDPKASESRRFPMVRTSSIPGTMTRKSSWSRISITKAIAR